MRCEPWAIRGAHQKWQGLRHAGGPVWLALDPNRGRARPSPRTCSTSTRYLRTTCVLMTSWLPEWTYTLPSLPSLPSLGIALPSSIQRRFVSFVLRRSLGRFLKPGQLDDAQVDSQIGSGFVQINDLELDHAVSAIVPWDRAQVANRARPSTPCLPGSR